MTSPTHVPRPNPSRDSPYVFLSYAREDIVRARRIIEGLGHRGIAVWWDRGALEAGTTWEVAITRAIEGSTHFVVLLSAVSSQTSSYVRSETDRAFELQHFLPAGDRFVIPVRLEEVTIKDNRLKALECLDVFDEGKDVVEEIARVVCQTDRPIRRRRLLWPVLAGAMASLVAVDARRQWRGIMLQHGAERREAVGNTFLFVVIWLLLVWGVIRNAGLTRLVRGRVGAFALGAAPRLLMGLYLHIGS